MNSLPAPDLVLNLSDTTLQDLLMASLDRRSRHMKAAKISLEEASREEAIALVAEYFLKYREELAGRSEPLEVRKIA